MEAVQPPTALNSWDLFPSDCYLLTFETGPLCSVPPGSHLAFQPVLASNGTRTACGKHYLLDRTHDSIHTCTLTRSEMVGELSCRSNEDNCGLTSSVPPTLVVWGARARTHARTLIMTSGTVLYRTLLAKRWTKSRGHQESKPSKSESAALLPQPCCPYGFSGTIDQQWKIWSRHLLFTWRMKAPIFIHTIQTTSRDAQYDFIKSLNLWVLRYWGQHKLIYFHPCHFSSKEMFTFVISINNVQLFDIQATSLTLYVVKSLQFSFKCACAKDAAVSACWDPRGIHCITNSLFSP